MSTLFFQPTSFNTTFVTGGGRIQFGVSGTGNLDKKWRLVHRRFHKEATRILEQHGASLCYEMANVSMPVRANTHITAYDAIGRYKRENEMLAEKAFKSWDSKKDIFWMMSDFVNVKDYIVQQGLFKSAGPIAENLAKTRKYDLLDAFLRRKGYWTAYNVPKPEFVADKAELGTFIRWKSQWKKNTERGPYYVRDKASIAKIKNESSIYNYAGIVINGWIAAAKGLGDKPLSGVRKVSWPYNKTVGSGFGRVSKARKGKVSMTIRNDYYNLNGIFYTKYQQQVWKSRLAKMEYDTQRLYQDIINYWNSIN